MQLDEKEKEKKEEFEGSLWGTKRKRKEKGYIHTDELCLKEEKETGDFSFFYFFQGGSVLYFVCLGFSLFLFRFFFVSFFSFDV